MSNLQPALPTFVGRARLTASAALMAGLVLAGCAEQPDTNAAPTSMSAAAPLPRPDRARVDQAALRRDRVARTKAANDAALAASATPASVNMRNYLVNVEEALIQRGKLRTDDGSSVGPITVERLVEDFIQTALRDEYSRQGGKLVQGNTPAPLRRWESPVRMQIEYGASVNPLQRSKDRNAVAGFAAKLKAATGHSVALTDGPGNFYVLILSEDERRAFGPRLAALVPGIPPSDIAALTDLAPQNYCTVFAYSRGNGPTYVQAVALVRSELPARMRLSCFHEELAQGMGLANDSPAARPSIFNDDEEFALLTRHDELLLRMLYDPRLRPGMTEGEARPILTEIATELLSAQTLVAANTPGGV